MTNLKIASYQTPAVGVTGAWIPQLVDATRIIIRAHIRKGRDFILLDDLYETVGAENEDEKCSVRNGVRFAKADGEIVKTADKGLYRIL